MISSYEIVGSKIRINTPYSTVVVETCRKWGGKYVGGAWEVSATRLEEVQNRLGTNLEDQVEVEVGSDNFSGDQQIKVGWYILAGRRSRDSRADIYADLVAGEIPSSGGSMKHPSVAESKDARFRLWVARDFAVARKLQIVTDPKADDPEPASPLAEYSTEDLLAELVRRGALSENFLQEPLANAE